MSNPNPPSAFRSCPACGATWPSTRPHCLACGAGLAGVEPIPADEMDRRRAESLDLRWLDAWGERRAAEEDAGRQVPPPSASPEPPELREARPDEGGLGAWLRSRLGRRRGG